MSENVQLTPEMQQALLQLQSLQQHLQSIVIQKESIGIQSMEIDKALDELSKLKEGETVYKAVGPILVKTDKDSLAAELSEKKEMLEVKLKSLESQGQKVKDKITELQKKVQEMFRSDSPVAE